MGYLDPYSLVHIIGVIFPRNAKETTKRRQESNQSHGSDPLLRLEKGSSSGKINSHDIVKKFALKLLDQSSCQYCDCICMNID